MNQIEGDTNFTAYVLFHELSSTAKSKIHRPPLKIAPVFGGIAGIVTGEHGDSDDVGHMPSISTKTREMSKLQDMYRQTLAASWAAQVGELPADKCVEEIFAGGDGWGGKGPNDDFSGRHQPSNSLDGNDSDGDRRTVRGHQRRSSPRYQPSSHGYTGHQRANSKGHRRTESQGSVSGRKSIEQQVQSSSAEGTRPDYMRMRSHEVDEFAVREDLKSWQISRQVK